MGLPISLQLDPQVHPVRLKTRWVPFDLMPKINEELDHLVRQGVLEPVPHATWETPIVIMIKLIGDVCIIES